MKFNTIYVTVGTTKFESLIREITSDRVLKVLKNRGVHKLIVQYGNGAAVDAENIFKQYCIEVEQYDFKFEPIRTDLVNADLVIGHAGAGTCMDILHHNKPSLVVINEELMDNHQIELALQLAEEGYLYYCTVKNIHTKLESLDFSLLRPYEKTNNMANFVNCLNELMTEV